MFYQYQQISNLIPIVEGVPVKSIPSTFMIEPKKTILAHIKICPMKQGHLKIIGLSYECCSLKFNAAIHEELDVISPLPLLKPTTLPSSISLFPGEERTFDIELLNTGSCLLGKAIIKMQDVGVQFLSPFFSNLPIEPNHTIKMNMMICTEKSAQTNITITYNSSSNDIFGRTLQIPLGIIISEGLEIKSWEITQKKNDCFIGCVVHNKSQYSFTVTIESKNSRTKKYNYSKR